MVLMIVTSLLVGITRVRPYKLASVGKTAPFSLVGKMQSHSFLLLEDSPLLVHYPAILS